MRNLNDELRRTFNNGTNQYHRIFPPQYFVTDGVKEVMENYGLAWFVTDMACNHLVLRITSLTVIKLTAQSGKADVVLETYLNGQDVKKTYHYDFTDCPDATLTIYIGADKAICLPSED